MKPSKSEVEAQKFSQRAREAQLGEIADDIDYLTQNALLRARKKLDNFRLLVNELGEMLETIVHDITDITYELRGSSVMEDETTND